MTKQRNPNLKKANQEVEITHDQVLELKRCAQDPIYFCETYVKIQHPKRGAILFDMYDYQKDMITMYKNNRYCIALSARQTGKCCDGNTIITIAQPQDGVVGWIKKQILKIVDNTMFTQIYVK